MKPPQLSYDRASVVQQVAPTAGSGELRGLTRSGGFAAVGSALGALCGLLLTLVVTHGLPQSSAGQFFICSAVFVMIQTLLAAGVGAGLVRFVPRYQAQDRAADVVTLLEAAVVPIAIASAVGSIVLWVCAEPLAALVDRGNPGALVGCFHVIGLLLLPTTLQVAAVEAVRAFGSLRNYVLLQVVGVPLLRPILVAAAIAWDFPLAAVVLMWLVPVLAAFALAAVSVGRSIVGLNKSLPAEQTFVPRRSAIAREYWGFALSRGAAMVIDVALKWLDVVMVASLVSTAQAAIYAAASRFITAGTIVSEAARMTVSTDMSAAVARGDISRVSVLYRTSTQWVVLLSWPLYLLGGLFASTVLVMFGSSYADGATAMCVLCLAMMVNLAAGGVETVLLMGGKSSWLLADKVASLGVNVGLNLLLIPSHGILGAACAWAVTIVFDSSLEFTQVRFGMGITGRLNGVGMSCALPIAVVGGFGVATRLSLGSSAVALATAGGVVAAAYPALVWRMRATWTPP